MSDIRKDKTKMLVVCIGNIARGDDGLGWRFADMLDDLALENVTIEYRYQLQVEDTLMVCEFPLVVFVDSTEEILENGFSFTKCMPATNYFFSSHMQNPENILYLSETLYSKTPEAYILAMEGEDWELGNRLSEKAETHLHKAFKHFISFLDAQ